MHIVSMSWLVESAGLAGSRLQCASAAIAGASVLIVPAAFLSSLGQLASEAAMALLDAVQHVQAVTHNL